MPIQTSTEKNTYKRDEKGLLYCHICGYQPPIKRIIEDGKEIIRQNKSTLKYHMDIHKGQLPHVCKHCNKGFLHKTVLEKHITAMHPDDGQNGVKQIFRCNVPGCSFTSIQKGNLLIHKSRKHCLPLVNDYLIQLDYKDSKVFHCSCCNEDFQSGTNFHHHVLKCLQNNNIPLPVTID